MSHSRKYYSVTAFALDKALQQSKSNFNLAFNSALAQKPILFKHKPTAAESKVMVKMTFSYSNSRQSPEENDYLLALRIHNIGTKVSDANEVISKLKQKVNDELPAILVIEDGILNNNTAKQLADEIIRMKANSPDDAISLLVLGDNLIIESSETEQHIKRIKEKTNIRVLYREPKGMNIGKGFSLKT